jgi:hypothetical protein
VDLLFLGEDDWKYEGSKAGEGRGGRTHTFGVKNPTLRLATARVYRFPRVIIRGGKPVLV